MSWFEEITNVLAKSAWTPHTLRTHKQKLTDTHIYVKNKCKNILGPITKDTGQAGNILTYNLFVFIQYFFCPASLSFIKTASFEALLSYYSSKRFSLILSSARKPAAILYGRFCLFPTTICYLWRPAATIILDIPPLKCI